MPINGTWRYSAEELAAKGTELYERTVRPIVEAENYGRVVAIDGETGEYALVGQCGGQQHQLLRQ